MLTKSGAKLLDFGLAKLREDPSPVAAALTEMTVEDKRLTAYAVDKSRVIVVEFQSRDPELAEKVANSIAEGYLVLQQNARQAQARSASQWLSGEIENLAHRDEGVIGNAQTARAGSEAAEVQRLEACVLDDAS